ncbi:sugar nucleotide-binding protein, partial [Dokdonia donghaensis]|uniref:sugar nucleotide-binding protein n=1 Tax=Dokdonia donghaensis TaxID=326320 RepID=UPI0035C81FC8
MSTLSRNIRLLVTGGGGQVAQAIKEEEATFENVTCTHLSKSELDITSTSSIKKAIDLHQPDVIINTAAYTAVDAAEDN